MKICICDDEPVYCAEIKEKLKKYELQHSNISFDAEVFCSLNECRNRLMNDDFDIVFMDIEMNGENGIDFVRDIKSTKSDLIVIYISAHPNYVFDSFETEPLNFITKPIDDAVFFRTLDRAINKYKEFNESVSVKWHHTTTNLLIKDINFVEGYNRHILFHLVSGETYETVGKLSKTYSLLAPHGFVQCHQGYLLNMNCIKSFGEDDVFMKNGDTVPMSVRKKLATKQAYYEYLMRS